MKPSTALLAVCALAGCGDNRAAAVPADARVRVDAASHDGPPGADAPVDGHADSRIPADANPLEPTTLAGTGLCVDDACTTISPGIQQYAPQFVLFADGASKRRWIQLPAGTQIDTTDMDHWVFPVGTKVWKEFTTADTPPVRIETRYMVKESADETQQDSWFFVSYAWNAAQTAATAAPDGVSNALGTTHDIPNQNDCTQCHNQLKPTRVLGFGAISLDFTQADATIMDLDDVIGASMLTTNPPGTTSPHYPLPGTATEKAALGYLHANCGHCHNSDSSIFKNGQTGIQLRLDTLHLAHATDTLTYTTTVDVTGQSFTLQGSDCPPPGPDVTGNCPDLTTLVKSGDAAHSILFARFAIADLVGSNQHMPQRGTKTIDPTGELVLQTWIDGL